MPARIVQIAFVLIILLLPHKWAQACAVLRLEPDKEEEQRILESWERGAWILVGEVVDEHRCRVDRCRVLLKVHKARPASVSPSVQVSVVVGRDVCGFKGPLSTGHRYVVWGDAPVAGTCPSVTVGLGQTLHENMLSERLKSYLDRQPWQPAVSSVFERPCIFMRSLQNSPFPLARLLVLSGLAGIILILLAISRKRRKEKKGNTSLS